MTGRYAIAVFGAVTTAALHFWAGRELGRWVPPHVGRVAGMLGIIALPVALGTAAVILVNSPMPVASVTARLGEASFWLFAAIGALVSRLRSEGGHGRLSLRWPDVLVFLVAVLVVRILMGGIPFVP
jgi:hypothetical protein